MDLFPFACQFTCRHTADTSDKVYYADSHILTSLNASHGEIYVQTICLLKCKEQRLKNRQENIKYSGNFAATNLPADGIFIKQRNHPDLCVQHGAGLLFQTANITSKVRLFFFFFFFLFCAAASDDLFPQY